MDISGKPTASLAQSFALDQLWRQTMGLPAADTKQEPLRQVVAVLAATQTPYALIGGVAIQLFSEDPRTTLDIDLAVALFADIPVAALCAAGFEHEARFAHSDNWRAPGRGREPNGLPFNSQLKMWASLWPCSAPRLGTSTAWTCAWRRQVTSLSSNSRRLRSPHGGRANGGRICWTF